MFSSVDTIWVLLGAALVFFMQAGFAMVETGFTRAKNAGNIIMKNTMDFAVGSIIYWLLGFGLMFGTDLGGLIGLPTFFSSANFDSNVPGFATLIFQAVFCATAATIVSGAMAERTKFSSYLIYSFTICAVVYPVSGHWIWGGGWLSQLGFHDFAGSTAVHMVGGVAALIGASFLGPRIGKYSKEGKSRAIPGHSLTLGALGVFILWFGWFGFNGASTLAATGDDILTAMSSIYVTTTIAASAAAVATMIITWVKYKKPDVSMTLNGVLAGLVGITAGCDAVSITGAFIIGIVCAFVVVFGIEFIDKVLKIDDPVGAVGVHGLCGAAGTILVGFLALDGGLFYGGGWSMVGTQVLGVLAVAAWVTVAMVILFAILKNTIGLRVSEAEEIEGLDIHEHGLLSSYADFMPTVNGFIKPEPTVVPVEKAIPVEIKAEDEPVISDAKMTKIEIVTRPSKLEALKTAMNNIGITGMTVTNVMGCGMQKGQQEYYRGVVVEPSLLPKVSVSMVVCKVPVRTVIETAKKVLYTGKIGDGKIFVSNIENTVKVRTGEEGFDALQDDE